MYKPFRLLDSRLEESLRGMAREEEGRMDKDEGRTLNGEPWLFFLRREQ